MAIMSINDYLIIRAMYVQALYQAIQEENEDAVKAFLVKEDIPDLPPTDIDSLMLDFAYLKREIEEGIKELEAAITTSRG